jgi:hypothetical protein
VKPLLPMRRPLLILTTLLALLAPVATAAASGLDVIRDCTDDEVMAKTYTQKEYRDALRQFAADGDQYGNCRDIIKRAQEAALAAGRKPKSGSGGGTTGTGTTGGGNPGGGAGAIGSAPAAEQLQTATANERRAVDAARSTEGAVTLDNGTVIPANAATAPTAGSVADLPTALIVPLALLLAGALALAAVRIRRLVHTRRA